MASVAELDVLVKMQSQGQGVLDELSGKTLGLGLAVGAVYEIGKQSLDNYEAQQQAAKSLAQAFQTQGEAVPTKQIQAFIDTNKGFIDNQYDVEQGIAIATRAGISWKDTQLLMADALNLSIDRHESFSQAMDTLVKAAAGGRAQLADLGITSKQLANDTNAVADAQKIAEKADTAKADADRRLQEELDRLHGKHTITQSDLDHLADLKAKDLQATQDATKAHQDLAGAQKASNDQGDRAATLHDLLKPKLDGETGTVTDLQQSQHRLNADWQDFSARIGPGVSTVLDGVTQALDAAITGLEAIGDNLGHIGDWLTAHANLGANEPGRGVQGGGRVGPPGSQATPQTQNNTFNISGAQSPAITAAVIARHMRQMNST